MKLTTAYICIECEEIFEPQTKEDINGKKISRDYNCPACTGQGYPLGKWIPTMKEIARSAA